MTGDFHVPFDTAYARPFVPKGCSAERIEYLRTKGRAIVQEITRKDASVAFRIVYPSGVPRFSLLSAAERTVEILHFGGKIWWPYRTARFFEFGSYMAMEQRLIAPDEWRDAIAKDHDLLKIVPDDRSIVHEGSFSRIDLPDKSDEVAGQVQRILTENFLVCDGVVYALGSAPVHAFWRHPRFGHVEVVSTGIDRRVTDFEPLKPYPGLFAYSETQEAFSEGRLWQADAPPLIELRRSQRLFAAIEVVDPTLMPADQLNRTQIDSLFRIVRRSLDWFIYYTTLPGDHPPYSERRRVDKLLFKARVHQAFQDATEPFPDDFVTDAMRMEALRALFVGERQIPKKHTRLVEALEKSFRALDRRNPREELAPEDSDALDRL